MAFLYLRLYDLIVSACKLEGCRVKIKEIGSFFVGGETASLEGLPTYETSVVAGGPKRLVDPNGDFMTGQMYVQYVKQEVPCSPYPVLMWHGGGCTGVTWESIPDGRPGWQMNFLEAGYDVYISDGMERGRSSWSRFPEIYTSEPIFRPKKDGWEFFRIGPSYTEEQARRVKYPDTQFPVESFDEFCKQFVPRWTTNSEATHKAYDEYLQRVGPCILIAHSQAGEFSMQAALRNPDMVKALILLEPTFAPEITEENMAKMNAIPHLYIWGDYIDEVPLWVQYRQKPWAYFEAQKKAGIDATWLDLPAMGIKGNDHFLMADKNSAEIAEMVQAWLKERGL